MNILRKKIAQMLALLLIRIAFSGSSNSKAPQFDKDNGCYTEWKFVDNICYKVFLDDMMDRKSAKEFCQKSITDNFAEDPVIPTLAEIKK